MPRIKTRDPRKRFASLYRFIETDLTETNWRELTYHAARFMMAPWKGARVLTEIPPRHSDRPPTRRAHIRRPRGAARWRAVAPDIHDLAGALAIQERFRQELAAIKRGDSSPAHTTLSRLLEHKFDRLKRLLTSPPIYAEEEMRGTVRTLIHRGFVYQERAKHTCPSCGRTYKAPPGAKRTSCGDRACRIDVENTRRKQHPATP